jgi:hypothetical protein
MLDTHSAIAAAHALPDPAARIAAVTEAMADCMVERTAATSQCTEQDLYDAGFTATQIIEFAPKARELATKRWVRRQARVPEADIDPRDVHQTFRELIDCAEEAGLGQQPGYARALRRGRAALDDLAAIHAIGA